MYSLGGDGKLELLDFKSQPCPEDNDKRLVSYYHSFVSMPIYWKQGTATVLIVSCYIGQGNLRVCAYVLPIPPGYC